jgi:hypothetical protein
MELTKLLELFERYETSDGVCNVRADYYRQWLWLVLELNALETRIGTDPVLTKRKRLDVCRMLNLAPVLPDGGRRVVSTMMSDECQLEVFLKGLHWLKATSERQLMLFLGSELGFSVHSSQ